MRFILSFFTFSLFLVACGDKKIPDVSNIKVDVQTIRFEKDLFAIDTTHAIDGMQKMLDKYPDFAPIFFSNILGLQLMKENQGQIDTALRMYIRTLVDVKKSTDQTFAKDESINKEIVHGFQFVKHYFPNYPLPKKIYTFIGPFDFVVPSTLMATGDVIGKDFIGVGLHTHLGSEFPAYYDTYIQQQVPRYITQRFTPNSIGTSVMRSIVDDLFPYGSGDKPLIEQMIEKGKRLYLLDLLTPETADSLKIGYTGKQLAGCKENEASIWNLFVQNELLYSKDPQINKEYIEDGPKTAALGEASPGNIGLFVGWQIVKKFMDKNKDMTPTQLMQTPAQTILNQAKYKPS
jgi:hypothetical protein